SRRRVTTRPAVTHTARATAAMATTRTTISMVRAEPTGAPGPGPDTGQSPMLTGHAAVVPSGRDRVPRPHRRRHTPRARPVRGQEGDRRPGPPGRAPHGGPPRPRPRPPRGPARPGQDAGGRDARHRRRRL